MPFKYLKAPGESIKIEDIKFPVLASYKLDGFRGSHHGGTVLSKTLKKFPNYYVQEIFDDRKLKHLDGELVVGKPFGEDVVRRTTSGLMSREGEPAVTWWVFDDFSEPGLPFHIRHSQTAARVKALNNPYVWLLPHKRIKTATELLRLEEHALDRGYEGLMLRNPSGVYKFGTATARENIIFKFKRFVDAEAVVLSVEEGSINGNEKKADGKRRTLKSGMTPNGMIGTLICMDIKTGKEVRVAPGKLSHAERKLPCTFLGAVITYRSFPTGTVNAPRFPRFHTFRDVTTV